MEFGFTDAAPVLCFYGTFLFEQSFAEVVNMQLADFLMKMLRQFLLFLCVCVFFFQKQALKRYLLGHLKDVVHQSS